jgi:hypothetical protein
MANQNTNNRKGKPREEALFMLNRMYDSLPEAGKDLSREEFINESMQVIATTKAAPKSKLILPEGM